jgi:hypothetical protein
MGWKAELAAVTMSRRRVLPGALYAGRSNAGANQINQEVNTKTYA